MAVSARAIGLRCVWGSRWMGEGDGLVGLQLPRLFMQLDLTPHPKLFTTPGKTQNPDQIVEGER